MLKLFAAALALAAAHGASAAPAGPATKPWVQLDAEGFAPTIGQGAWLVEFIDAKPESEKFAATWAELAKNKEMLHTSFPGAPFNFAQVDCKAYVHLCIEQGITATPRILTYRDGVPSAEQYHGAREYVSLSKWADQQAAAYRKAKGVSDTATTAASPASVSGPSSSETLPTSEEQKEPASPSSSSSSVVVPSSKPVAPLAGPNGPNPDGIMMHFGEAPIQDKNAFAEWLSADGGHGPSFVKFMAPWCPHCRRMGPAFQKLSSSLKGQVNAIEVNCEEHNKLCQDYRINSFPTLRMYRGDNVIEYTGGRSHDAMYKWALGAGGSPLRDIVAADLKALAKQHDVFLLYLYSPGTPDEERKLMSDAASVLLGKDTYAFQSSDQALIDRYSSHLHPGQGSALARRSLSGLLVFKGHEMKQPYAKLNKPAALAAQDPVAEIRSWIHLERFPRMTELISSNFADVIFNDAGVNVILAAVSDVHHGGNVVETGSGSLEREYELANFRHLVEEWYSVSHKGRVFFAWIDADRWATAMKAYFNLRGVDLPQLLLVDGSKKQYYDLPSDSSAAAHGKLWIQPDLVFERLNAVAAGQVKPKSMQTYIDRSMHAASSVIVVLVGSYFHHPFIGSILLIAVAILTVHVCKRARPGRHGRHGSRRLTSRSALPFTNVGLPGKTKSG